ncbi:MAG: lipopolysaccharide biosynthesis protein [Clostridiales bacterium]|nr:lipopolysaccharide biosynthesis protein [Clostridiales bacterium]
MRKRVIQGIGWRTFVDMGEMFLQIAFTALLARILSKADFGLIAMALLVNRFLIAMTQIGFGIAIIQSPDIKKEQISAIFYINAAINFAVSLICFAGAPLAASFFNQDKLIPLIRLLAWVIFIDSFGFPNILLRKKLKFAGFSILEIATMLAANVFALILALKGYGVWALAMKIFLSHVLFVIGIWFISDWFPGKPSFQGVQKLFQFGLHMLGSKICNYFSQNLAAIITGKFIGVDTLGAFNIAYNLALVPAQKIQSVLTSVLTPAFSAIQTNVASFRKKFFESLYSLSAIYVPLMLGLSVVGPTLVPVLYGSKWKDAGLFVIFLAPIGLFKGIQHVLNSAIISRGWPSVIFRITLIETGLSIPLLFAGSFFFKIIGLISAYLIVTSITFYVAVLYAQKAVNDNLVFLEATKKSLLGAVIMVLFVILISLVAPFLGILKLVAQISAGAAIYLGWRFYFLSAEERKMVKNWPFFDWVALRNSKT